MKGLFSKGVCRLWGRSILYWKADLALLCVKSYHNQQAMETMKPAVDDGTAILTLQNGIGSGDLHLDDAARVVVAVAKARTLPDLLLVSDGSPLRREDYFKELCQQLGASPVCFEDPGGDSERAQRALSSKRVCNTQMLNSLDLTLEFPEFSAGLSAILANGDEVNG